MLRRLRQKKELYQNISKNKKGQLSIFMGITISIIITCIAFVINVGLFVNAKINIQNAVDAASYSGAAVQARLLTQMGYLNWEMRNNYKEFLFKYYVIGNLANSRVSKLDSGGDSGNPTSNMRFRPRPFFENGSFYDENAISKYNIPNICINFSDSNNICDTATVPGLPRFESVGLPAIAEHHENFLNEVAATKAENCSQRTDLNFGTAMIWAYGVGGENSGIQSNAPQIAGERVGVWPKAIELGLRMRNLEYIANRPPVNGICATSGLPGCSATVDSLISEFSDAPINERPIKSFMSAMRNLSGGSLESFRDLKNNLVLTEIAPEPHDPGESSLGGFLIPKGSRSSRGSPSVSNTTKYYVDLQAVPINYAVFYRTFTSMTGGNAGGVDMEAKCFGAPTGIPIPNLVTGFVKNPEVLTYYAVKANSKFVGLFYPFTEQSGIELNAYSAAKPMGGRIGPRLFEFDNSQIKPRAGQNSRSAAYLMGIANPGLGGGYKEGYPIPPQEYFMENQSVAIGGTPDDGNADIRFSLPNMIYDWLGDMNVHTSAGEAFQLLTEATWKADQDQNQNSEDKFGLYDKDQFRKLLNFLPNPSGSISGIDIRSAILKTRRPTRYDAANYMVPTFHEDDFDGVSPVFGQKIQVGADTEYIPWALYAPLFGQDFPAKAPVDVRESIENFIKSAEPAVNKFLEGLKGVAEYMEAQTTTGGDSYVQAANKLFPLGSSATVTSIGVPSLVTDCDNAAIASNFAYFFNSDQNQDICGMMPLANSMISNYLENIISQGETAKKYLGVEYVLPTEPPETFMSAYRPGPRQGAEVSGDMKHPFLGRDEGSAKRNYYSVKHIPMRSLVSRSGSLAYFKDGTVFPYKETTQSTSEEQQGTAPSSLWKNVIANPSSALSEFGSINDLAY